MRRLIVLLAATAVVGCLGLVAVLGAAVAGGVACPLALLEGELVAMESAPGADAASRPDTLGVRGAGGGDPARVTWPFGYRVERQDGALVLVHLWSVAGREGDRVAVGGGSADDGSFTACGPVSVGTAPPPGGHVVPWPTASRRPSRRSCREPFDAARWVLVDPPEQPVVGCTAVLETWDESRVKMIRVVFDGFDCRVTLTPDTES